ncbi:MAG: hypothetical protein K9K37_07050 [Desulfocapsa sp.]|nr:hypothetical protein [Desulfocapsa sp.]
MFYFYLFFCVLLPVASVILFLRSVKLTGMPANARLIVDAWNSVSGRDRA